MAKRNGVAPSGGTWRRRAGWTLLLVLGAGCSASDLATAPTYAFVNVIVNTTGGDPDVDGYKAVVDGVARVLIWRAAPASVRVEPGTHSVSLNDVAPNCTVSGAQTRSVNVGEGKIVDVRFDIACVATGLTVTTSTAGADTPDSIDVLLGGETVYRIAKTDTLDVGRLVPGSYRVEVLVPENCAVSGGATDVVVVAGAVAAVPAFQIACVPVVRSPRIAYVVTDTLSGTAQPTIESIGLDGSSRVVLATGDAPAWSPDGTKLLYSTADCALASPWDYGDECGGGVMLVDPETGNHAAPSGAARGFRPAWAPSRDAIAFEVRGYAAGPATLTLLLTTDSSVVTVPITRPEPSSLEQPTWSPDGARIAVTCTWRENVDLCLLNRDGSGLVHLTDDALQDRDPAWSPDGKTIAFTRRGADASNPTSTDVALLDLTSGLITLLAKGSDPTWSPDGSKLAFAGSDGIFVMNANGTNRTRLTSGSHSAPAWRP